MSDEKITKIPTSLKIYAKPVVIKGPTLSSATAASISGGADATGGGATVFGINADAGGGT